MRRVLFYLYYFTIGLPLFVVLTLLVSLTIIVGNYLGFGAWATQYCGLLWARLTLLIHWCPVSIEGLEHLPKSDKVYVVVANHQSAFDIFVLYGYIHLPFKWVLKEGLRRMPVVGRACASSGFIFVDDTKPSSITQTMEQARKTLSSGSSIFIFPEGSRTPTGRMLRFKKGAFVMASELDVPILPVSIDGAYDVLKRGHWLPHPHRIRLTIHPEINPKDYGEAPRCIMGAAAAARERIASVLPREQSTLSD